MGIFFYAVFENAYFPKYLILTSLLARDALYVRQLCQKMICMDEHSIADFRKVFIVRPNKHTA